eukprot:gene12953-biopygen6257
MGWPPAALHPVRLPPPRPSVGGCQNTPSPQRSVAAQPTEPRQRSNLHPIPGLLQRSLVRSGGLERGLFDDTLCCQLQMTLPTCSFQVGHFSPELPVACTWGIQLHSHCRTTETVTLPSHYAKP